MDDHSRGGNDTLIAGAAPVNNLYGDAFSMSGNARGGNDILISGPGTDHMWGDAAIINGVAASPTAPTGTVVTGADTFVFAPGSGNDDINDFRQSDHDKIDVSAYGFHNLADMTITAAGRGNRDVTERPCWFASAVARIGVGAAERLHELYGNLPQFGGGRPDVGDNGGADVAVVQVLRHKQVAHVTCSRKTVKAARKHQVGNLGCIDIFFGVASGAEAILQRRHGHEEARARAVWLDEGFARVVWIRHKYRPPAATGKARIGQGIQSCVRRMIRLLRAVSRELHLRWRLDVGAAAGPEN